MGSRVSTLSDVLNPQQFQIVILLTLGLDSFQIADLLDISTPTVYRSLSDSVERAACTTPKGLVVRLLFEWEGRLYGKKLDKELAKLQTAAMAMLQRIESASTNGASLERTTPRSNKWLM